MQKSPNNFSQTHPLEDAMKRPVLPIDAVVPDAENTPKTTSSVLDTALKNVQKQLNGTKDNS